MTHLTLAKPAIEALPRHAWRRIERHVFGRLEATCAPASHPAHVHIRAAQRFRHFTSLPWARSTVVAVSAACAIAGWQGITSLAAPRSTIETGSGLLERPSRLSPGTPPAPPAQGEPLAVSEPSLGALRLVADEAARELSVGESRFSLASGSEMLVHGDDVQGWQVELLRGQLDAHVAARHGRPPVVVQAGDVTVRVVGTRFSVKRADHVTAVAVK